MKHPMIFALALIAALTVIAAYTSPESQNAALCVTEGGAWSGGACGGLRQPVGN